MKKDIVNIALKNDLKSILGNPDNVVKVFKGGVSGFSIEIEFKEPQTFSSYTYYELESLRDADWETLQSLIENKENV